MKVMEGMLRGTDYLRKKGGFIKKQPANQKQARGGLSAGA
jgi:hypothetical protein